MDQSHFPDLMLDEAPKSVSEERPLSGSFSEPAWAAWNMPEHGSYRGQAGSFSQYKANSPRSVYYPTSSRYGMGRHANTEHRVPQEKERPSTVLWQLTLSLALGVLVFCSYQSSQSWAVNVRNWTQFVSSWDYSTQQIVQWIEAFIK